MATTAAKRKTKQPASEHRGRPALDEPYSKVTLLMFDRHIALLDRACVEIRLIAGVAVSRSEVFRYMANEFDTDKLVAFIRRNLGARQ